MRDEQLTAQPDAPPTPAPAPAAPSAAPAPTPDPMSQSAQRFQRQQRIESLFEGLDTFDAKVPDSIRPTFLAQMGATPDPQAARARAASQALLSFVRPDMTDHIRDNWDQVRNQTARMNFGATKDVSDTEFYGMMGNGIKERNDFQAKATQMQQAIVEGAFENDMNWQGKVPKVDDPKMQAKLDETAAKTFAAIKDQSHKLGPQVSKLSDLFSNFRVTDNQDVIPQMIDMLEHLPADQRQTIISLAAMKTAREMKGATDDTIMSKVGENLGRGTAELVQGVRSGIAKYAALRGAGGEEAGLTQAQLETNARRENIRTQLMEGYNAIADPQEAKSLMGKVTLGLSSFLPSMAAVAVQPEIGLPLIFADSHNRRANELMAQGVPEGKANTMAAPQALVDTLAMSVSSKVLFGTGVAALEETAARSGTEVLKRGAKIAAYDLTTLAGVTAAQQLMPAAMQDWGHRLDEQIPETQWADKPDGTPGMLHSLKKALPETAGSVVALMLLGAGRGTLTEYGKMKTSLRDTRALVGAGFSAEQANQIADVVDPMAQVKLMQKLKPEALNTPEQATAIKGMDADAKARLENILSAYVEKNADGQYVIKTKLGKTVGTATTEEAAASAKAEYDRAHTPVGHGLNELSRAIGGPEAEAPAETPTAENKPAGGQETKPGTPAEPAAEPPKAEAAAPAEQPPSGLIAGSKAEAWADSVLKERGLGSGAVNTLDPQLLAAYAVKGAAYIEAGVRDFAAWSKEMVSQFGEKIRPHLRAIFDQAQQTHDQLTAYHGSPHKFEMFSSDKIGTGEGAQAYGHGLYFAQDRDTAMQYQPRDEKQESSMLKEYHKAEGRGDYTAMEIWESAMLHKQPNEIIDQYTEANGYDKSYETAAKKVAKKVGQILEKSGGAFYKVKLNVRPDDVLDWDKPMSEQPQKVRDALIEAAKTKHPDLAEYWDKSKGLDEAGRTALRKKLNINIFDTIDSGGAAMAAVLGRGPEASRYLTSKGIQGIQFLDNNSRNEGKGTRNFVMFDAKDVTTLERNGKTSETWYDKVLREAAGRVNAGVDPVVAAATVAKATEGPRRVLRDISKAPQFTEFRRVLNKYVAEQQLTSLRIRRETEKIMAEVPEYSRRVAITNWLQADGDIAILKARAEASTEGYRKGYEDAMKLTPREIETAKSIQQYYKDMLVVLQKNGVLQHGVERYANQMWQDTEDGGKEGLDRPPPTGEQGQRLLADSQHAKERVFGSYFEGEQAGRVPVTKDIAHLVALYTSEVGKVIASRRLLKELTTAKASDGRPLAAVQGSLREQGLNEGVIVGDVPKMDDPALIKANAKPEGYAALKNPSFQGWKFLGKKADGQQVMMLGDMALHPEIYQHMANVFGESGITTMLRPKPGDQRLMLGAKAFARGALRMQQIMKGTTLGFLSPFHQVQEGTHAIGHHVNPFWGSPDNLLNPENPLTRHAVEHGLMIAGDNEAMRLFKDSIDTNLVHMLSDKLGGEKLGNFNPVNWSKDYSQYLFHSYIPRLKMKTFLSVEENNLSRYAKEMAAGTVTKDDVAYLSAKQVNNAYGHMNWADIGVSPTATHILRIALLAPDFLAARTAFTGESIKGALGAKSGREQIMAFITLAATQYLTARVLNKLADDDYHWDHPLSVVADGREYTMRSVPEDIYKMIHAPEQFMRGRISPLSSIAFEALFQRNYRGEKVDYKDEVKDAASMFIPLTLRANPLYRTLMESSGGQSVTAWQQLMGAMGIHISRNSPIAESYKLANDFKKNLSDEDKQKYNVKEDKGVYPTSQYQQLRYALEDGDTAKALKEIEKLKAEHGPKIIDGFHESIFHPFTGSNHLDQVMLAQMPEEQRQMVELARHSRQEIWKSFNTLRQLAAAK